MQEMIEVVRETPQPPPASEFPTITVSDDEDEEIKPDVSSS